MRAPTDNARLVRKHDKHYLFRLNDERWHLQQLAAELLATKSIAAERLDVVHNHKEVHRTIRLFRVNRGILPFARKSCIWEHAKVLIRVDSETRTDGNVMSRQTKYYISSLGMDAMGARQWLDATVLHWGVETCHQVLDVAFLEDDKPWIRTDPNGMLAMLILRRVAYTLMTLWRSVTLRSDDNRHRSFAEHFEWAYVALVQQSRTAPALG